MIVKEEQLSWRLHLDFFLIIFISFLLFYQMEAPFRQLRKYNTAADPREQLIDLCWDQPQKALFQVSQNEIPVPLQMRPVNVDPWFPPEQVNPVKEVRKQTAYFRRTVHWRGSKIQRCEVNEKDFSSGYSSNKSIIPRLKNLLHKLESPEKKSKNETPIIENPIFFEQNNEVVREVQKPIVKSHNVSIRITNHSSQKKYRKVGTSLKTGKNSLTFSRNKPALDDIKNMQGNFQEHLTLIREARRKRTLRNLLF